MLFRVSLSFLCFFFALLLFNYVAIAIFGNNFIRNVMRLRYVLLSLHHLIISVIKGIYSFKYTRNTYGKVDPVSGCVCVVCILFVRMSACKRTLTCSVYRFNMAVCLLCGSLDWGFVMLLLRR